jgi:ABC-type cobalamin/Fe3+-siderophores transport system ATPase subunit
MQTASFIAIIGPNGIGKSQEIERISKGETAKSPSLSWISASNLRKCAFVPQAVDQPAISTRLSALLITPIVLAGASLSEARKLSREYLARFKLDHLYDRTMQHLSGGEGRISNVLAGIIASSYGIILDDPFSMLDKQRADAMFGLLSEMVANQLTSRKLILTGTDVDQSRLEGLLSSSNDGFGLFISEPLIRRQALDQLLVECCGKLKHGKPKCSRICRNLTLSVPNNRTVLRNFSYTFDPGHIYTITGPNGSGKSLLLGALAGRLAPGAKYDPVASSVERCGCLHSAIADVYLPQHSLRLLASTTPLDALQRCCRMSLPVQSVFQSIIWNDRPTTDGSIGEVQFITQFMAAISALHNSHVEWLIIDEPDAYLDISRQRSLATVYGKISESGRGVILATHHPEIYKGSIRVDICDGGVE